jgi:Na+/melibiose symporter-like transporter
MNSDEREAKARQRFIVLNLTRFLSVFLVLLGVAIISGRLLRGLEAVGYIFMIFGVAEFFLLPVLLKKMWQKQDGGAS